jgi:LytS/YehU family sensor histidine kinase
LKINDNDLEFTCKNQIQTPNNASTGIGLENTRRRLNLLYPNRHQLDIRDDGQTYEVYLQLVTHPEPTLLKP